MYIKTSKINKLGGLRSLENKLELILLPNKNIDSTSNVLTKFETEVLIIILFKFNSHNI